jgi:hypothetical protein
MERPFDVDGVKELAQCLKDGGRDRKKAFELLRMDYDSDEHDEDINKILDEVFA